MDHHISTLCSAEDLVRSCSNQDNLNYFKEEPLHLDSHFHRNSWLWVVIKISIKNSFIKAKLRGMDIQRLIIVIHMLTYFGLSYLHL